MDEDRELHEEYSRQTLRMSVRHDEKFINIYHKLPKPRELINPQMLGSTSVHLIQGFYFKEYPLLLQRPPPQQPLSSPIKSSPIKLENAQTLYEYYSPKPLIYCRNSSIGSDPQNFNQISYQPKLKLKTQLTFDRHLQLSQQNITIPLLHSQPVQFESNFESGNLNRVYKTGQNEYDLLLGSDINTTSYTQWFFFKVTARTNITCTFNIVNFMKSHSLYVRGMKVLVHDGAGWIRGGSNISYRRNLLLIGRGSSKTYSTLSFSYSFYRGDEIYFAYSHPYTYSQLNNQLDQLEKKHLATKVFSREVLCETQAGNRCEIITISKRPTRGKPVIFISARVHPGQTVSSYVLRGMLNFLLSNSPQAVTLRQHFVFKIVPMLNPDGVVHGNYRCNLSGQDLNRTWQNPDPFQHSQIYNFKKYILREQQVVMFIDLHGHSSKKNIFIYGCSEETAKEFPYLASRIVKGLSFKDCAFEVVSSKEGTARVALWRDLRMPNIFTVESSFCAREEEAVHFRMADYQEAGAGLCKTIHLYFSKEEPMVVMRQNYLKQLPTTLQFKDADINDSAQSQQDTSRPIKSPQVPRSTIQPKKAFTGTSLIKQMCKLNKNYAYSQSPLTFSDKRIDNPRDECRRCLIMPKVLDMSAMTPIQLIREQYRRVANRDRELFREKFLMGSIPNRKRSPSKPTRAINLPCLKL